MGPGVRKNTTLIIHFVEEERLLSSQIETVTQPEIAKSIFHTTKWLGRVALITHQYYRYSEKTLN